MGWEEVNTLMSPTSSLPVFCWYLQWQGPIKDRDQAQVSLLPAEQGREWNWDWGGGEMEKTSTKLLLMFYQLGEAIIFLLAQARFGWLFYHPYCQSPMCNVKLASWLL